MPNRKGVTHESPFVGPGMRGQSGLHYFPCRLSLVPALLTEVLPPDVVLVQTSAPSGGTVSLGTEVNVLPAAIESARSRGGLVIAQLNPRIPYTYGDSVLPCDAVDYAIEAEAPLASPPERPVAETSVSIGDRVAAFIGDGATLQAGIGAVPDAVLAGLHRRRGLAVWSEMFSDGVLGLAKAGALDPAPAGHRVVRIRQRGPLRLDGPQPGRADAADRDGQRPGADRSAAADDLRQRRAPGRPVRSGQRDLGQRAESIPGSAGRRTSWSARCTHQAARRSSRFRPGTPRPTCPPWCHGSTGR